MNILDHLAGQPLPTGDIPCDGDVPSLRSYHLVGACGARNTEAAYGSQLVPARRPQGYVLRIGEGGNPGLGCHLHDFSVWNNPDGDGLVLCGWDGLLMQQVGFQNCGRGLVLDATQKASDGDFHFWANKCGTGCYINWSRYKNRVCNILRGPRTIGNEVGLEIVDVGPKELPIERLHCEASTVAGVIQRAGTVFYSRMYNEHKYGTATEGGKPYRYLRPGAAVKGGVAIFERILNLNYLYLDKGAEFEADALSESNIGYIVLTADDPRVNEFASRYLPLLDEFGRPYKFRVLTVSEEWEKGKLLQFKGVTPIAA